MKKYLIVFLILFVMFIGDTKALVGDDCANKGTCLTLCSYNNTYWYSPSTGARRNYTKGITIYYNYKDKNITVNWSDTHPNKTNYYTKTGGVDYIFSNAGNNFYWGGEINPSLSNFVCPKNAYLDHSSLSSDNELCFDDDGSTCINKYSNSGTAFGTKSQYFVSTEKNYDIRTHIANYSSLLFKDIKDDINAGKYSDAEKIKEKIEYDFSKNFLNGNDTPEFIVNLPEYQTLTDNVLKEYENNRKEAVSSARKDAEKEKETARRLFEGGFITQEEYEKRVKEAEEKVSSTEENWGDVEEVKKEITNAFANISFNVTKLGDFNVTPYCDSFLGDSGKNGTPAYYLQFVFNLMKYIAIVLLFVLTIAEFAKAMVSNNQDAMKKAIQTTIKRLIIAIVIFFLPIIIDFIFKILGIYSRCGIR